MEIYRDLTSHILRSLRGKRTQQEMSKLLKYGSNQYYKFEAGIKVLRLNDLIKLSNSLGIDLPKIFSKLFPFPISRLSAKEISKLLINNWLPQDDKYIAEKLETSSSRIWRIRNGKSDFTFVELLAIIDLFADRLPSFLSEFIPMDKLPPFLQEQLKRSDLTDLLMKFPEAILILVALDLEVYKQAPSKKKQEILKTVTKMSHENYEIVTQYLQTKGYIQIQKSGELSLSEQANFDKVRFEDKLASDSGLRHFAAKNLQLKTQSSPTEREGNFRILSLSKTAKMDIKSLMLETNKKLSQILENDMNPKEEISFWGQFFFSHWEDNCIQAPSLNRFKIKDDSDPIQV